MAIRIRVKADPIAVTGGTSTITADNLGGVGLFAQKVGSTLEFKGLVAGSNITLTESASGVTIASTGGGGGGGVSQEDFDAYTGSTAVVLSGIETGITSIESDISTLDGEVSDIETRYVSGGTSLGGHAIFSSKANRNLRFKGLVAGSNITLTPSVSGITIASSGVVGTDWGSIGGTITDQTDLMNLFSGYVDTSTFNDTVSDINEAIDLKLNISAFNTYSGNTQSAITSRLLTSTFNSYTGSTATALSGKVNVTLFNQYTGETQTALAGKVAKSLFDGYTGDTATAISNRLLTSTFNDYSGNTQSVITNGLALKVDKTLFDGYSGSTATALAGKVSSTLFNQFTGDTQTALGLKVNKTLFDSFTGETSTALGNRVLNSTYISYTGATATALAGKVAKTLFDSYTGSTATALSGKVSSSLFNTYTGNTATVMNTFVTGATNLGSGEEVYSSKSGKNLQFKTITVGENLAVSGNTNNVHIAFTGETGGGGSVDATIVLVTGTTTIDATYAGKIIHCNGTFTLTLPSGMNVGMQVTIVNIGTGVITIDTDFSILQSKSSFNKLSSQYGAASVYHRGSNDWIGFGDLTAS